MDAPTAQSIRRLCDRLEAMRAGGAIRALMAEYRVGAPEEECRPLSDFEGALWSASVRMPERDTSRAVWLAADGPRVATFRATCADAARVAIPTLRQAGFAVGLGATNECNAWLWSIFEMAALRLPGVPLRLEGGDIYRVGAGGVTMNETAVSNAATDPSNDPFAALLLTAGPTRYWRLIDAIEASLAVLDIAQTWPQAEANAATPRPGACSTNNPRRPARSTKKIDVDHYLGRLEAQMRKKIAAELGSSETAIMEAMIREVYSLSAEDLVPLLKPLGFKGVAKTTRRNSEKYGAWERYRKPLSAAGAAVDPTQPTARNQVLSEATARVEDAVESGNLNLRVGGRGITQTRKNAAERAADRDAEKFARDAGVELPPAD
jgi:hypothetical protein